MIGRTHFIVIIAAVFIILVAGLILSFIFIAGGSGPNNSGAPKTSVPRTGKQEYPEGSNYSEDGIYDNQEQIVPVFPLETGEVFIQAVNADINMDGTYDQICALRQITDSRIYIVCAIQNPVTGIYSRLDPLRTEVTQARTLLMYLADITGEQKNSLVYSGMNSDNLQVLGVYLVEELENKRNSKDSQISFKEILNISADGSITVEEIPRSDAYNLGLANGDSYPVVSYSSVQDENSGDQNFNQMQRTYRWDQEQRIYTLASEKIISARNSGTRVLRKLSEGGVPAFSEFLRGLWYKDSLNAESQQIFFNLEDEEIIFKEEATEEIFRTENISARRYGVYLITKNSLISNIRRLIDIEIIGVDEIKIRVTDDVRLKIGVGSMWDGTYRKLKNFTTLQSDDEAVIFTDKIEKPGSKWTDDAGNSYSFVNGNYTYTGPVNSETGKYAVYLIQGEPVMQMKRHKSGETVFYLIENMKDESAVLQEIIPSTNGFTRTNSPAITIKNTGDG